MCESDYPGDQSQDLSDKVNASRESCGCPQSDNLNNDVSSKEQFVTSKMSRNGKFIEDRSSGSTRPIRDRHAPVRYGDPIINYDDSPDACFTVCSLDFHICENSPKTYKQAMASVDHPKWSGELVGHLENNLVATLTWTLNKYRLKRLVGSYGCKNYLIYSICHI